MNYSNGQFGRRGGGRSTLVVCSHFLIHLSPKTLVSPALMGYFVQLLVLCGHVFSPFSLDEGEVELLTFLYMCI